MRTIGIGLVGAGYMGKRHAVALKAVGAVFNTELRPECEVICSTSASGAAAKAAAFDFKRSTDKWQDLVEDRRVEAIIIASPQTTHLPIALAAIGARKPVLCEKPLGASLDEARKMAAAAASAGVPNMVGFNYIRTPASQLAYEIIKNGEIGDIYHVRAEHTEDYLGDPEMTGWRTQDRASGNLGDTAPHIFNAVLRLVGPIEQLIADIQTVHTARQNDDQVNLLCRFANDASGCITVSRVATGRKMGYAYEITGTKGALRFDQEDQNSLWLYECSARPGRQGFRRLLTGPDHPDYKAFCLGPGHGTGYDDQIIIEARDFLMAIETGKPVFPTFEDGLQVSLMIAAAFRSNEERRWVRIAEM